MKLTERKDAILTKGRELQDQATKAVEDITDAAASVRASTDTVAWALIGMGVLTCVTLLLVVRVNVKMGAA